MNTDTKSHSQKMKSIFIENFFTSFHFFYTTINEKLLIMEF